MRMILNEQFHIFFHASFILCAYVHNQQLSTGFHHSNRAKILCLIIEKYKRKNIRMCALCVMYYKWVMPFEPHKIKRTGKYTTFKMEDQFHAWSVNISNESKWGSYDVYWIIQSGRCNLFRFSVSKVIDAIRSQTTLC